MSTEVCRTFQYVFPIPHVITQKAFYGHVTAGEIRGRETFQLSHQETKVTSPLPTGKTEAEQVTQIAVSSRVQQKCSESHILNYKCLVATHKKVRRDEINFDIKYFI